MSMPPSMAIDLRDEEQVVAALQETQNKFGRIDAAIYNAGAQHRKPMLEISGGTFEKVWRLGCFGAFVFGREAVRHMLPAGRGTVLFTGATASRCVAARNSPLLPRRNGQPPCRPGHESYG